MHVQHATSSKACISACMKARTWWRRERRAIAQLWRAWPHQRRHPWRRAQRRREQRAARCKHLGKRYMSKETVITHVSATARVDGVAPRPCRQARLRQKDVLAECSLAGNGNTPLTPSGVFSSSSGHDRCIPCLPSLMFDENPHRRTHARRRPRRRRQHPADARRRSGRWRQHRADTRGRPRRRRQQRPICTHSVLSASQVRETARQSSSEYLLPKAAALYICRPLMLSVGHA